MRGRFLVFLKDLTGAALHLFSERQNMRETDICLCVDIVCCVLNNLPLENTTSSPPPQKCCFSDRGFPKTPLSRPDCTSARTGLSEQNSRKTLFYKVRLHIKSVFAQQQGTLTIAALCRSSKSVLPYRNTAGKYNFITRNKTPHYAFLILH